MKTLKLLGTLFVIAVFIFKPAGITQVNPSAISKEKENKEIKARLEQKQAGIINNLNQAINEKKPKVIYKTKWRTVYLNGTPENCDTIYYVVKKNNLLQRIRTGKKTDTIQLKSQYP